MFMYGENVFNIIFPYSFKAIYSLHELPNFMTITVPYWIKLNLDTSIQQLMECVTAVALTIYLFLMLLIISYHKI